MLLSFFVVCFYHCVRQCQECQTKQFLVVDDENTVKFFLSRSTHLDSSCPVVIACLWLGFVSGSQSEVSCVVAVINPLDAVNVSNGFTYKSQLTPMIAEVSPRRGGTAGGTRLTISGSGFRCGIGKRHNAETRPDYVLVLESRAQLT